MPVERERVRRRLYRGIAGAMSIDGDVLEQPGTTIAPADDRAGSRRVAWYSMGQHAVLWCDPALAERLQPVSGESVTLTEAGFRELSGSLGGDIIGQAVMKTRWRADAGNVDRPGALHRFDWNEPSHVALVSDLIAVSDQQDLDEAEIGLDELDELAVGLLDADGRVAAYASARPFEYESSFGDIGVMVRSDVRSEGWGRAVVAALIDEILVPSGIEPLYRCDPENHGSDRLSRALGFEPALRVVAAEFAAGDAAAH